MSDDIEIVRGMTVRWRVRPDDPVVRTGRVVETSIGAAPTIVVRSVVDGIVCTFTITRDNVTAAWWQT